MVTAALEAQGGNMTQLEARHYIAGIKFASIILKDCADISEASAWEMLESEILRVEVYLRGGDSGET